MTGAAASGNALLEVEDLSVSYGKVQAVRGVSLRVERGRVLGILGRNGAGKTSLLKALTGLVKSRSNRCWFDGKDITRAATERRARAGITLVPEGRRILGPLTVAENLRLGAFPSGRISEAEMSDRIGEVVQLFPILGERHEQRAATLSGGQAAMLAVARALMSRPALMLLDEPTLGLAPLVSAQLFERLGDLRRSGMSMIVVEQKAQGLLSLVDEVIVLHQGNVGLRTTSVDADQLVELYFGSGEALQTGARRGPADGSVS